MPGDQIEWYESRSAQAQRTYKRLKIVQISVGAVIPFPAGLQEQLKGALADELDLLPGLLIAARGVIGPLAGVSGRVPLRSGSAGS